MHVSSESLLIILLVDWSPAGWPDKSSKEPDSGSSAIC